MGLITSCVCVVCVCARARACVRACLAVCLAVCLFNTTVGSQPNLARIYADRSGSYSNLKNVTTLSQGGHRGIFGGQQFKNPGNDMNCPENQ